MSNTRKDGDFNLDQELFNIDAATEEKIIPEDSLQEEKRTKTPLEQFQVKYHINSRVKRKEEKLF